MNDLLPQPPGRPAVGLGLIAVALCGLGGGLLAGGLHGLGWLMLAVGVGLLGAAVTGSR